MSFFSYTMRHLLFFYFLIFNSFLNAYWSPARDLSPCHEKMIVALASSTKDDISENLSSVPCQPLCISQIEKQENVNSLLNSQIRPAGLPLEIEQFQIISDSFGNQTAAWLYQGNVQASSRTAEGDWQAVPELLSSTNEIAQDLHLAADSMGNVFVIWQAMPSNSIQASIKLIGSNWKTDLLTNEGEKGANPQIAEGPDGYVIAVWKQHDLENDGMRCAEFSLPLMPINENSEDFEDSSSLLFESTELINDELISADSVSSFFNLLELSLHDLRSLTSVDNLSNKFSAPLPSALPFPPTHLHGHQVVNTFATQTDLINVINWHEPIAGPLPIAYYIYRNRNLTKLAAIIPADRKLQFNDHNRQSDHLYTYFLVSVDAEGNQSPPAGIVYSNCFKLRFYNMKFLTEKTI
jgi:hypothetical protein